VRRGATRRPKRDPRERRAREERALLTPERVLMRMRSRGGSAWTPSSLARALGDPSAVRSLRRLLRTLEAQGAVARSEGRYRVRRDDGALEARLELRAGSGAWFAVEESGERWRIADPGDARAGDRVLVKPTAGSRGELLHVVEGARETWIGILHRRGGISHATPYRDDADWWLRVASVDAGDARDGEVVELAPALRRRPKSRRDDVVWARVVRRIGRPGEADADFAAVTWRHRLPIEFPQAVVEEVAALAPARADAPEPGRLDLRALPFVTIDPVDARDFDDAVCAETRADGGLRLWIAVADVSHYVRPGSALDREAWRRSNSVYFPDRAIPMLPHRLSGDLCSLRPQEDRLAMVVELDCDARAEIRNASVRPAWIRSRARLSYDEAQAQLESGGAHDAMLRRLADWAGLRARTRRERGGLDFDLPGVVVEVGDDGRPRAVRGAARHASHRLVEEAMLAANQSVAEWLAADAVPVPYRNHEAPTHADTLLLAAHLEAFGVARDLPRDELPAQVLARALARVPPERAPVLHGLVLRHMRQARYGAASLGHYALAMQHYLHFTSPIRRYADLVVHRAVMARLAGDAALAPLRDIEGTAARTSFRERLAERAEREMKDLARCAFLREHVGSEQEGTISAIGRPGIFVTLSQWPIDGLVPAPQLGGAEPDVLGHAIRLPGGVRLALGDAVRVRIVAVDVVRARNDFELLLPSGPAERGRRRRGDQERGRGGATTRRGGGRSRSRTAARL
jgi:ribonuclease R